MPWLLTLHIAALVCWCAGLLYMPALIAVTGRREAAGPDRHAAITRMVFTLVVTPAALLAIISGTAVFLANQLVAAWLVAKLTLVTGLVVCHVLLGWLIVHIERGSEKLGPLWCALLGGTSAALMVGIIYLVLAKPF